MSLSPEESLVVGASDAMSCSPSWLSIDESVGFLSNFEDVKVSSPNEAMLLSSSFEKFSLIDCDISPKRPRWDSDSPTGRKSNSAPGTPTTSKLFIII